MSATVVLAIVGGITIAAVMAYLAALGMILVRDWFRSRRAYVRDVTEAREYMAVGVMLSRRVWVVQLPGAWVTVSRPLYRKASDAQAWAEYRAFAMSALRDVKKYAPTKEDS